MLIGSIMRTFIVLSLGLLPLGNFAGSKSGGKYLFSTFRSPMSTSFVQLHQVSDLSWVRVYTSTEGRDVKSTPAQVLHTRRMVLAKNSPTATSVRRLIAEANDSLDCKAEEDQHSVNGLHFRKFRQRKGSNGQQYSSVSAFARLSSVSQSDAVSAAAATFSYKVADTCCVKRCPTTVAWSAAEATG